MASHHITSHHILRFLSETRPKDAQRMFRDFTCCQCEQILGVPCMDPAILGRTALLITSPSRAREVHVFVHIILVLCRLLGNLIPTNSQLGIETQVWHLQNQPLSLLAETTFHTFHTFPQFWVLDKAHNWTAYATWLWHRSGCAQLPGCHTRPTEAKPW